MLQNVTRNIIFLRNKLKKWPNLVLWYEMNAVHPSAAQRFFITVIIWLVFIQGIYVPEKYGGTGLDYLAYAIAMEEISRFTTILIDQLLIVV